MNTMTLLVSQLQAPSGLWTPLINWLHGGIGNFGWTILILSIIVKLVVSPLEFFVKLTTKKQNLIQQKCAPQVAKLQKKFGKDQQNLRIQTNALYKREGLNMGTGCIIMLVNMVITLAVFISFFNALNANSAYQAIKQYETLSTIAENSNIELLNGRTVYFDEEETEENIEEGEQTEIVLKENVINSQEDALAFVNLYNKSFKIFQLDAKGKEVNLTGDEKTLDYYKAVYQQNQDLINEINEVTAKVVVNEWNNIKASWLWVDNIWIRDAIVSPFPSYNDFIKVASTGKYASYIAELTKDKKTDDNTVSYEATFKEKYESLATLIQGHTERKNNGYFILAIIVALLSFASQYLAEYHSKKIKNKKAQAVAKQSDASMQQSMKLMKFILPIIMVAFVIRSSASFGIYILASNIISIVIGEISTFFIDKITRKQQLEVEEFLEKEANRQIKKGKLQEIN